MTDERSELRKVFFTAWHKFRAKLPVEPLEAQMIDIIRQHPEYHSILENPDVNADKDFAQDNPFMHLSLHLSVREQVTTNRPAGIKFEYERLVNKFKSSLDAEHQMMDCLAAILWNAQRNGAQPDENEYLGLLKNL